MTRAVLLRAEGLRQVERVRPGQHQLRVQHEQPVLEPVPVAVRLVVEVVNAITA